MISFSSSDIVNYCGQKSYDKGVSWASTDDFIKIFVQGNALYGLYQGSVGVYRINIISDTNMPTFSWCTCPAMTQYDGTCKHIAGLMILWQKEPGEFTKIEPWKNLLADKDKDALLNLLIAVASKSIEVSSVLYEELQGEPLVEYEDMYGQEWY